MNTDLERRADATVFPGFSGTAVPDWLRRRIAEGVRGVVLYHDNMAGPEALARLTAGLRAERADLLIALDEEGGDVTRLHLAEGSPWPGNLALGAAGDPELTREVAHSIGTTLAGLGVNVDLAPVVDVNTAAGNPVIGTRSFGAEPESVAAHGAAYVRGLQATGVAGCAKHFPGHGSTVVDSHHDLPVVAEDREAFEAVALPPFRAAIEAGVAAVMTAHIRLPAYDDVPATISRAVLTGLLREQLGFDGLVITDSLEMHAVCDRYGIAGTAVRALAAGADALCVGTHRGEARARMLREEITAAVRRGELTEERLTQAARRVEVLAERFAPGRSSGSIDGAPDRSSLTAARRALTSADLVPLTAPPLVIELHDEPTPAIGATAWGLGALLADRLSGTTVVHTDADAVPPPDPNRPLLLVVRDLHRRPRTAAVVADLLAARPDAVLVEMGLPRYRPPQGTAFLATRGASRVSALAAVEVLTGRRGPAPVSTAGPAARRERG
ncbi:glycoside hydrolase family 3 protein [Catenulispora subtropica]|uniref:Glycoside hydrolase family 3 protein n=1 Tax=Catenulispora subtropica TaxID=450798 RepID=A0ABN2SIQ6_9ACTN